MADFLDELIQLKKEFDSTIGDLTGIADEIRGGTEGTKESAAGKPAEQVTALWDRSKHVASPGIDYSCCAHVRYPASTCRSCVELCPAHALTLSEGSVSIESLKCVGCGLCARVCPTHAIRALGYDPCDIDGRIREVAASYETVYLTCAHALKREPAENVFVLPCLALATPELWFSLLVNLPAVAVYLPLGICASCPLECAQDLYEQAIDTGERWAESTLGFECTLDALNNEKLHRVEREEFVNDLLKTAGKTVGVVGKNNPLLAAATRTKSIASRYNRQFGRMNTQLDRICGVDDVTRTLVSSRKLLLTALSTHKDLAANVALAGAEIDAESCKNCGSCAEVCPTGACHIIGKAAMIEASYCIGCGLCTEACPHDACAPATIQGEQLMTDLISRGLDIEALFDDGKKALVEGGRRLLADTARDR